MADATPKLDGPKQTRIPTCCICLEPLFDAVSLKCGHSVCERSAQGLVDNNQDKCPLCRMEFRRHTPNYDFRELLKVTYPEAYLEWHERRKLATYTGLRDHLLTTYDVGFTINAIEKNTMLFLELILELCKICKSLEEKDDITETFKALNTAIKGKIPKVHIYVLFHASNKIVGASMMSGVGHQIVAKFMEWTLYIVTVDSCISDNKHIRYVSPTRGTKRPLE